MKLNASQKRSFIQTYAVFFLNGLMALSIGSIMPYLREARNLDYVFCGFLVSMHSVGNLASSILAGMLPMAIGRKKSILVFNILYPIAYLLICNSRINSLSPGKVWMLNGLHASLYAAL